MRVCSIEGCERRHSARGWCRLHYLRWQRTGDPLVVQTNHCQEFMADIIERWTAGTLPVDECIEWPYSRSSYGYGHAGLGDGSDRTTSVSMLLLMRTNPPGAMEGMEALHSCDNRPCCNLNHLSIGTHAENIREAVERGRMAKKLTKQQVVEIRRRYAAGGIIQSDLAAEFGVSDSSVSYIVNRKSWSHISESKFAQTGAGASADPTRPGSADGATDEGETTNEGEHE